MGWGRAGLVAALALTSAAGVSAYAQVRQYPGVKPSPCWQAVIDSKSVALGSRTNDHAFPFAGVRRDPSIGLARDGCEVVSFYRQFDAPPPMTAQQRRDGAPRPGDDLTPRFIARFASGNWNNSEWVTRTKWADGDACAGLEPALEKLADVVALRFTGDGLGNSIELTMDGVGYSLWARGPLYPGRKADYVFSLEMESNVGTPLAVWTDGVLQSLESCWTDTQPVIP